MSNHWFATSSPPLRQPRGRMGMSRTSRLPRTLVLWQPRFATKPVLANSRRKFASFQGFMISTPERSDGPKTDARDASTIYWSQQLAARIRELIVLSYRLIVHTCAPASQRLDV